MQPNNRRETNKATRGTGESLVRSVPARLFYVFLACAGIGLNAHAQEPLLAPGLVDEVVIVPAGKAHPDLRQILSSELEQDALQERRRLSREERDALHRDLRAVLRNVNANYGADDRAQR